VFLHTPDPENFAVRNHEDLPVISVLGSWTLLHFPSGNRAESAGRPEIQKFAGALQGQRARKGIFITTSKFTKDALNYVENIDTKIILIDGQRLAELMIAYSVGANTTAIYEVKKIDSDYFIEE